MVNPRGSRHVKKATGKDRSAGPRKKRRPRKEKAPRRKKTPESPEAVRHYGESWEFEHYEKESHKASGLFL